MRPLLRSMTLVPSVACFGLLSGDDVEREQCDAYLACLAEVAPGEFAQESAAYGAGGSCWEASPDNCERACTGSLAARAQEHPDNRTCNPTGRPPPGFRPTFGMYTVRGDLENDTCGFAPRNFFRDWDVQGAGAGLRIQDQEFAHLDWRCGLTGRDVSCSITQVRDYSSGAIVDETSTLDATWTGDAAFRGIYHVDLFCVGGNCGVVPREGCSFRLEVDGVLD